MRGALILVGVVAGYLVASILVWPWTESSVPVVDVLTPLAGAILGGLAGAWLATWRSRRSS